MKDSRSLDGGRTRLAIRPVAPIPVSDAARGRRGSTARTSDWFLIPEMIGVVARVAVWSGAFCLLLISLFTYPAPVAGAFVLCMLVARYVWRKRL